jgi:hypothetical protein
MELSPADRAELAARERDGVNAMHPTARLDMQISALDQMIAALKAPSPNALRTTDTETLRTMQRELTQRIESGRFDDILAMCDAQRQRHAIGVELLVRDLGIVAQGQKS